MLRHDALRELCKRAVEKVARAFFDFDVGVPRRPSDCGRKWPTVTLLPCSFIIIPQCLSSREARGKPKSIKFSTRWVLTMFLGDEKIKAAPFQKSWQFFGKEGTLEKRIRPFSHSQLVLHCPAAKPRD